MEFVQKTIFSGNGISRDLVDLLGAVGEAQVQEAFEKSKQKEKLEAVFRNVLDRKYISLESVRMPKAENIMPYQSMERALVQLKFFEEEGGEKYYSPEQQKNKVSILLESVSFIEAEALVKLMTKDYDVDAVRAYLYPKKVKKDRIKTSDEEEPLSNTYIAE